MNYNSGFIEYFLGRGNFSGMGVPAIAKNYTWKLPKKSNEYLPECSNLGCFEANVKLKFALSKLWEQVPERRFEIAAFIVKDWGGIKNINDSTIQGYVQLATTEEPIAILNRISSYSKVLAVRDPQKFSIYDARVAVSMMAIQILSGDQKNGQIFSYLPGRNNITGNNLNKSGFTFSEEHFGNQLKLKYPNWIYVEPDDTYKEYLRLMHAFSAHADLNRPIYELEMALFSDAEALALRCDPNLKKIKTRTKKWLNISE